MYKHFTQPNVVFPEQIKQEKKSRKSTKNGLKHLTKKDHHSKELSEKKKGLLRVAKKYRITELITRYVNICKSTLCSFMVGPRTRDFLRCFNYCSVSSFQTPRFIGREWNKTKMFSSEQAVSSQFVSTFFHGTAEAQDSNFLMSFERVNDQCFRLLVLIIVMW